MNNSKIAKAMMEAEALGFEFKGASKFSHAPYTEYYEFECKEVGSLTWDSSRIAHAWSFKVWGRGESAVDAINAAAFKAKALTSAPTE